MTDAEVKQAREQRYGKQQSGHGQEASPIPEPGEQQAVQGAPRLATGNEEQRRSNKLTSQRRVIKGGFVVDTPDKLKVRDTGKAREYREIVKDARQRVQEEEQEVVTNLEQEALYCRRLVNGCDIPDPRYDAWKAKHVPPPTPPPPPAQAEVTSPPTASTPKRGRGEVVGEDEEDAPPRRKKNRNPPVTPTEEEGEKDPPPHDALVTAAREEEEKDPPPHNALVTPTKEEKKWERWIQALTESHNKLEIQFHRLEESVEDRYKKLVQQVGSAVHQAQGHRVASAVHQEQRHRKNYRTVGDDILKKPEVEKIFCPVCYREYKTGLGYMKHMNKSHPLYDGKIEPLLQPGST